MAFQLRTLIELELLYQQTVAKVSSRAGQRGGMAWRASVERGPGSCGVVATGLVYASCLARSARSRHRCPQYRASRRFPDRFAPHPSQRRSATGADAKTATSRAAMSRSAAAASNRVRASLFPRVRPRSTSRTCRGDNPDRSASAVMPSRSAITRNHDRVPSHTFRSGAPSINCADSGCGNIANVKSRGASTRYANAVQKTRSDGTTRAHERPASAMR
jgi:hypothetical protein